MFLADPYTGYLFLSDLLNSLQGDCSIRMTALLEYLDLALAAPSWISCYNSVGFKSDSSTPLKSLDYSIYTAIFKALSQAVYLVGVASSRFLLANLDCVIVTHCWFFRCIFLVFSSISFKPQKV